MKALTLFALCLILVSCAPQQSQTVELPEQSTALDHPPTDYDRFNEVKKEIDHWYNQPPYSIGSQHKMQLMDRLLPLDVPKDEKVEYRRKLDSILLTDDPAYVAEEQKRRQAELDAQPQQMIRQCKGSGTVEFTHAPMRIEDIELIQPIGLMIGGHVTPIDHGYYFAKTWTAVEDRAPETFVDVFAPAAGLIEVQTMPEEFATSSVGDYRLVLYHTCTFYTIYIHVNQLSEKLQQFVGKDGIAVEAGELLGKAPGFDFSVHNEEITLPGFVVQKSYDAEPFKLHNVDLFDSFVEPVRTQLLEKNMRQVEPRGGKIDYDIDSKLVGNWFEENTNGYFGKPEYNRLTGYWSTHLAFAYDALDSSLVIVSMGDFDGEAMQFAVKGNAPDPKDIDQSTGLVKYELVKYDWETEAGPWDRSHFAKIKRAYGLEEVHGVALVQMLEDRKIKFESFPGKKATEVLAFTEKAKMYTR
ncbi:MAG TPA: hypothetical protein VJK72_05080 [Candidatus Nanoarchaeia archaeon]|nr:hypothetical protein [Candidatus Nanoarchaeia archaeon]